MKLTEHLGLLLQQRCSLFQTNSFRRDALVSMSGVLVSRLVTLLAVFYLMYQYYDQEAFGYWATITASTAFLVCLATMRLELALVLPKYDFQARQLMAVIMLNSVLLVLLVLLFLLAYSHYILPFIDLEHLWLVYLVPVLLFTKAIQESSRLWLTRKKQFGTLAIIQVVGAIIMPGIAVILAEVYTPQAWQLPLAAAISQFLLALLMLTSASHYGCLHGIKKLSARSIKKQVIKYRVYPFFMMPYALSQGVTQHLFILLLGVFFNQAIVGAFSLAKKLFYAPVNMVVSPLRQVFYAHGRHDSGRLVSQQRVIKMLFLVAWILPAGVVFLQQQGIAWLFSRIDQSFQETQLFAHWLLLPAMTNMLTGWLDRFYDLYGKQQLAVKLQIISDFLVFSATLTVMLVFREALITIMIFAITLFMYDLFWLAITLTLIGISRSIVMRLFALIIINLALCWLLFAWFDQFMSPFMAAIAKIAAWCCLALIAVIGGGRQKSVQRIPVHTHS